MTQWPPHLGRARHAKHRFSPRPSTTGGQSRPQINTHRGVARPSSSPGREMQSQGATRGFHTDARTQQQKLGFQVTPGATKQSPLPSADGGAPQGRLRESSNARTIFSTSGLWRSA
ncbi:hypothetical protein NDU88_003732 [Pleurodeles waltl]|uniref:Uncharacterized protein n=1 Tax=Pleurodeles waltl TaxID=8319 RepID=A0AAV7V1G3_PLEWA|nr:hypothetical protein NDU88_003732 [Pleurodeles waltl]